MADLRVYWRPEFQLEYPKPFLRKPRFATNKTWWIVACRKDPLNAAGEFLFHFFAVATLFSVAPRDHPHVVSRWSHTTLARILSK